MHITHRQWYTWAYTDLQKTFSVCDMPNIIILHLYEMLISFYDTNKIVSDVNDEF